MTRRTEFLAILLAIAASVLLVGYISERSELFECEIHGVILTVDRAEMMGSGALIFGRLPDGREAALGRYNIERCRRA